MARIRGKSTAEKIYGSSTADFINGSNGRDRIFGNDGNDRLYGEGDDDKVFGQGGNDILTGGAGKDRLSGSVGADNLDGGAQADLLYGGADNDKIRGGGGNDTAHGGSGDDKIFADSGNDKLFGDAGNDSMLGGTGNDKMYGGLGNDRLSGQQGHDFLYGKQGDDVLYGGDGKDYLSGSVGDDILYGGDGNDTLLGGSGDDILVGGAGIDRVKGGSGTDTIRFSGKAAEYDYAFVDGSLEITHARGSKADGTTIVLDNFEKYKFSDATFNSLKVGVTAGDDSRTVAEHSVLASDSVLSNDFDPQVLRGTETLTVSAVNGSGAAVGNQITLPSGALLTMDADGTFTYDPNGAFDSLHGGQSATDTFSYTASDGHGHTDTATVSVRVTGQNDPPSVTAGAVSTINVLNLLTGIVDPTITISDPDDTQMEGARVSITSGGQPGDVLHFTDQNGITGSFDGATGVLTLDGTASIADYETALESVLFEAGGLLGGPVGLGVRTISFEVSDGDEFSIPSPSSTASINVV